MSSRPAGERPSRARRLRRVPLRPRLVLNPADDTVYATVPEAGSLAAVNDGSFPFYARDIPQPYIPDTAMANDIPEALWPAAVWGDNVLNAQGH